jgi:hypothetical protein
MSTTKIGGAMADGELAKTIAHHDAAISHLGGRLTGVEGELKTLKTEVHTGFATVQHQMSTQIGALGSKLDKFEGRPTFNFHESVRTVLSLAALFGMVVTGIIWVSTNQFAVFVSEQKTVNATTAAKVEKHEALMERIAERIGWTAQVQQAGGKR